MNEEELIRLIRKSMDDHEQDYGPDVWSSWTYHDKVNGVVDQTYTRDQIEKIWYQIIIAESDGVVDAVGDTHLKDINLNKSNGLTQINKQYTDEGESSEASSAFQIWADNEGVNTLQVPFHAERLRGDPSYNLKAGMMLAQWYAWQLGRVDKAPNPFSHWTTFNERESDDDLVQKWSTSAVDYNVATATLDNEVLVGKEGFGTPDQAGGMSFSRKALPLKEAEVESVFQPYNQQNWDATVEGPKREKRMYELAAGADNLEDRFTPAFMNETPEENTPVEFEPQFARQNMVQ
tara:strand:+ start:11 stop:883 length:873 start_codon:yes stop_codon:yes gene_type:complete